LTEDFLHIHLSEIDPNNSTLPTGVYTAQLTRAAYKEFEYKTGPKAGTNGAAASLGFVIINDPDNSGRKLSDFLNLAYDFNLKSLRRLSDAAGVPQNAGEPLDEFLARLQAEQVTVKLFVTEEDDKDWTTKQVKVDVYGNPVKTNKINWREVQPA
jgi:hypothetical protein